MKILLIDNYDSFTYNLAHMLEEINGVELDVVRNDKIPLDRVNDYEGVIISPGPGIPVEAGQLNDFLREYATTKNIFGVCLGHQAIGQFFGGSLTNTAKVHHGISSEVQTIRSQGILAGLGETFNAARYHSWIVDKADLPKELEITAETKDGVIMAMRHREYPIESVQFHPESILTPKGKLILENWIKSIG